MNDQDGFRIEAALQFGFSAAGDDDTPHYICSEAELIAFAKACERKGIATAAELARKTQSQKAADGACGMTVLGGVLHACNEAMAALDAEIEPILEAERRRSIGSSSLQKLHRTALASAEAFEDAASYEETQWTGWGDGIVPLHAEMRRVKAGQAVSALRDAQKVEVTS